jgi:RPA family protein
MKIKIYHGVALVTKVSEYSKDEGINVYRDSPIKEMKMPEKSHHFAMDTVKQTLPKYKNFNHNKPFKLQGLQMGEEINEMAL